MKKIKVVPLAVSLLLPFIAGGIGSLFTFSSIKDWYQLLNKPFFSPPNWVFSPVWTLLYVFMGFSLYLVWVSRKSTLREVGLRYFFFQLILNALWSILFFGLRNPLFALLEIIILWFCIYMTIVYFRKVNKTAAYLLYPYIIWVSFASVLNGSIVILNR